MTSASNLISIVIPTYDRPEILKENIALITEAVREENLLGFIKIYISDDSINSKSKNIVDEIKLSYPDIIYSKNSPSLGHDKNLFHSLNLPDSDYVWMLGDSIKLKKNSLSKVIKLLSNAEFDIVSLNGDTRNINIESGAYKNCIEVINNFGWHLTMTGATIYSKRAISHIANLTHKNHKNFPQFFLIFDYLSVKCSFYWINDRLIGSTPKESYWLKSIFSIFIDDWTSTVLNLPATYDKETLDKVILEHSLHSEIFKPKVFLTLRMMNYYNINHYRSHKKQLVLHSGLNALTLFMIAVMNPFLLKIVHKIYKKFSTNNIFTLK